jgi:hypothetical protein
LGCSDGSFVEEGAQYYHGWIYASEINQTIGEGHGPSHGHHALLSAYRAELGGLLALVYMVARICRFHNISSGTLCIYCDNKTALSKVTDSVPHGITPHLSSDYDLVAMIHLYLALFPITVVGEWVKGHYSGKDRKYKHDLNDRADQLATTAHRSLPKSFVTSPTAAAPSGFRLRLLCKDGLITSNYYRILTQAHHDQPIIDYIIKKTGWTLATFNEVDWDSHQRAFKRLTRFQRIGISKLIHNLSNTNRQNKLYYGSSDLCPGCSKEEETFEHVLRCSFPATMEVRATALDKLHKSLVAIGTPSQVVEIILKGF